MNSPRVVWLATGLHTQVTGIERFALTLLDRLLDDSIVPVDDLLVVADADAVWVQHAAARGVEVVRREGSPAVPPRGLDLRGSEVIHNFGHAVFPYCSTGVRILTVCDWGPFKDRTMGWRARASWAQSLARGSWAADRVHFLNAELESTRPALFRRPDSSFVAYPDVSPAFSHTISGSSGRPLFVGTADERKRLPLVVAFAEATRSTVTLVGQGTEHYSGTYVDARGRVSEDELDQAYATASAILLVSSYEGFGIPVVEAARRGIFSVVSPEVAAVLPPSLRPFCRPADPHDVSALKTALDEAETARGTATFTENLLDPMVETYREVLGRP